MVMTRRIRKRGQLTAFAAACVALAGVPAGAHAGVAASVVPSVPSSVGVGQTVAASLVITNNSSNGPGETDYDTDAFEITDITLVPSCGSATFGATCPAGFDDEGVLVPAAGGGTGRAGTSCAGKSFTIVQIGLPADGEYRFTPTTTATLGASSGPLKSCTIDYGLAVNRVPAIDSTAFPGLQTEQKAFASVKDIGTNFGLTGAGIGTTSTTVSKATPAISTQVSPAAIGLGQSFTDTATLTGGVAGDRRGDLRRLRPRRLGVHRPRRPHVDESAGRRNDRDVEHVHARRPPAPTG